MAVWESYDPLGGTIGSDANILVATSFAFAPSPSGKQKIPLCPGWNLISFQINRCYYQGEPPTVFIPEGVIMQDVGNLVDWLSDDATSPLRDAADPSQAGNWDRVISFDYEMGYLTGHLMVKDDDPRFNNVRYIGPKYGYWIRIEDPQGAVLIFPESCAGT